MELQNLKNQLSNLNQAKTLLNDTNISFIMTQIIDKEVKDIQEKIIKIQDEENNKKNFMTYEQIKDLDVEDFFKVGNILDYSRYWQTSKDDREKYIIKKMTNKFLTLQKLKQKNVKEVSQCKGGYIYYKSKLIIDDDEDDIKVSKSNFSTNDFFKNGIKYELNKEFDYTMDIGR
jgi:hypothetical protein